MKRASASSASGVALTFYVLLLPYVVWTKWQESASATNEILMRTLLSILIVLWMGFLIQVSRNVVRMRHGRDVRTSGAAWIAGLILAVVAFTHVAPGHQQVRPSAIVRTLQHHDKTPGPLGTLTGVVPMALAAKKRLDDLRHEDVEHDIDSSIELLRHHRPDELARLSSLAGEARSGVIEVPHKFDEIPIPDGSVPPTVALALDERHVAFAREGGVLTAPLGHEPRAIARRVTALHDGVIDVADDLPTLMRALATRAVRHSIVLFTGPAGVLDSELSASCVTIQSTNTAPVTSFDDSVDVVVELLRAEPRVTGLSAPFLDTLRRRCVEMTAYLAVHRHEPVTGDRLRVRVLANGDSDASQRTLTNTASAIRRSLGADILGPRLHPVTAAGLYTTHGVSSDLERFSTLVTHARRNENSVAATFARSALELVQGEVLASTLRGFEWFVAEGHSAQLARDGEWASLTLHHYALAQHDFDLAFWAIQQGLLLDSHSDALRDALARVPRLREFGGNRRRRAQDESISTSGTVMMRWSSPSFVQQISQ